MTDHVRHDGRRLALLAAVAVVLAVAGAVIVALGLRPSAVGPAAAPARTVTEEVTGPPGQRELQAPAPTPAPTSASAAEAAAPAADLGPILPASEPVRLDIPSIDVHSDVLEPLAVGADGVLPAPADYALPGWYTGGPNPGQLGPAVIAGHVDGPSGPAVFYRLGELAVGAEVMVTRADGTVATFVIDAVERYAKADFPTARVYGNTTDRAELRLITCGGAFDAASGHYVDNIVAFAHLIA